MKGNNPRSVSFDIQTVQRSTAVFIATGIRGVNRKAFDIGIGLPNYEQSTGSTEGVIGVVGWNADFSPTSPFISDGYWHSVLFSYDGTTLRIWIDGVLSNVATQNTFDRTGNRSIFYDTIGDNNYLGGQGYGNYFNGNLNGIIVAVLQQPIISF